MSEVQFPAKLRPIFNPYRYKVIRGGRGSGKSWGVARALILLGLQRKMRILCARETQRAIRESVHHLLVDQIAAMGLAAHYRIQQVQITGVNGTEFVFTGLSDLTADSIKSFEGADIVWIEEAQSVTRRSWQILIPTIRKEGSEIWMTLNPQLDSDPTWERFIEDPPPNTLSIEMNWRDNPWFSDVLNNERLTDQAKLKDYEYQWIWEGKPLPAVTGAIYADDVAKLYSEGRVCDVPVNPSQPAYAVFDLGWNDQTSVIVCQRVVSSLRLVDYHEMTHKRPDYYSQWLRERDYPIQELFLPHDGAHDHLTGQSAQRTFEDLKWLVTILPPQNVEEGIRGLRQAFPQIYVDKTHCGRLLECFKRYRRVIPPGTQEPAKPLHDEYSHGCDAARYMALAAPMMDRTHPVGSGLVLPKFVFPKGM